MNEKKFGFFIIKREAFIAERKDDIRTVYEFDRKVRAGRSVGVRRGVVWECIQSKEQTYRRSEGGEGDFKSQDKKQRSLQNGNRYPEETGKVGVRVRTIQTSSNCMKPLKIISMFIL